jgi:exosome complex RNA-binding protein Csl4
VKNYSNKEDAMGTSEATMTCSQCGGNLEQTEEGLYCKACDQIVKKSRAVHHEGFPHVVVDEDEQEQ